MSEKLKAPALPVQFALSFAVGLAAAGGGLAGAASLMVKHGLSQAAARPLAMAAACVGSLLAGWLFARWQGRRGLVCGAGQGSCFALVLLLAQGVAGTSPGAEHFLILGAALLAGALGGLIQALAPKKKFG